MRDIAQRLRSHSKAWRERDVHAIIASLTSLFNQSGSELHWRVDSYEPFRNKAWPSNARYKFNNSDMSLTPDNDDEDAIREQSVSPDLSIKNNSFCWTSPSYKATKRPPMKTVRLDEGEDELLAAEHEFDTRKEYWEDLVARGGHRGNFETGWPPSGAVVIIPLAVFTCVKFLERSTISDKVDLFDKVDLVDKAAIRGALRWQLNEVC